MGLVVYVLLQIEGTRYHIGSALFRWIISKLWIKQREIKGVQPESINPAIKPRYRQDSQENALMSREPTPLLLVLSLDAVATS